MANEATDASHMVFALTSSTSSVMPLLPPADNTDASENEQGTEESSRSSRPATQPPEYDTVGEPPEESPPSYEQRGTSPPLDASPVAAINDIMERVFTPQIRERQKEMELILEMKSTIGILHLLLFVLTPFAALGGGVAIAYVIKAIFSLN